MGVIRQEANSLWLFRVLQQALTPLTFDYSMKFGILLAGLAMLLASSSASAYVDPGSGMLMWQGLIAAVGAVLVFVRNPKQSIKRLVDRFKRK